MGDRTAFFYGTLMAPAVLHRVCHGPRNPTFTSQSTYLSTRPAILHDHRRHRVGGADYPAIVPSPTSTVRGTLVTGLTAGDIHRLDIFEGSEYRRSQVKVRLLETEGDFTTGSGNIESVDETEAETYIWIASKDELDDAEWDFGHFMREKVGAWSGQVANDAGEIDSGFADVDREDEMDSSEQDRRNGTKDPTGGRGLNGTISSQLQEAHDSTRVGSDGAQEGEPLKSAV